MVRNRDIADARPPVPYTLGVKEVPSVQAPADKQPLVRGGTTSGSPGQLVRFWNRWRENYNALTALTIGRVRYLLEMAQRGDYAYPQWTYRTIERRHPVLSALITCCESPISNFKWDVVIKKELPPGFTEEQATAQQIALKAAYGQIDNLPEAITHLAHADFSGYAHLQKHYGGESGTDVVHLECLYQYCICRDGLFGDWFWNPDSRAMTMPEFVLTEKNRIGGDMLPRVDFVIREVPRPINEIALENFVRRKLIEKDWSAFDEIFGIPSGVVIMPSGIPPEKVAEYESAARQISEGGSGAMPNGSDYKANTPPHDGSALFKGHMEKLDEDLVLVGTGGKLKMLVEHGRAVGGGNVRGSSKTQADTFLQIAAARGGQVCASFAEDFDKPFLADNFEGQPALVEFKLITEDDVDIGEICTNVAALAPAGVKPDLVWLNEITGYKFVEAPATDPNAEIGKQKAQASPEATPRRAEKGKPQAEDATLKNRASELDPAPIADALHGTLLPLLKRLEAIAAVTDPVLQQHMLEKLLEDEPQISAAIAHDPSIARALSPELAAALVEGMARKPLVQNRILNGGPGSGRYPAGSGKIPEGKAPPRISIAEADKTLTAGIVETDSTGKKIRLGRELKAKLDSTPGRKELLEWGRDTVRTGKQATLTEEGELRTHYGKVYQDEASRRAFQVIVDTKDGYAFNMHILRPSQLAAKIGNRERANTDEQPSAGVLQALAAAGGLPDWFKYNLDLEPVNT